MKKFMNWLLATILICGASMFTSCSKDDKNDESALVVNNNVYEVNLTAIVHDCSAPVQHYFKIEPAGYDEAIAVNVGKRCGEGSFTF